MKHLEARQEVGGWQVQVPQLALAASHFEGELGKTADSRKGKPMSRAGRCPAAGEEGAGKPGGCSGAGGAQEGARGWEFAGRKKMLFSWRKKGRSPAAIVMAFPPTWEKIPCSFQHLMAPSQLLGAPRSCSHLHPPAAAGGVPYTQGGWPRAATSVFGPLGPAVTSQAICSPEPPASPRHLRRVPSPVPRGGHGGTCSPRCHTSWASWPAQKPFLPSHRMR